MNLGKRFVSAQSEGGVQIGHGVLDDLLDSRLAAYNTSVEPGTSHCGNEKRRRQSMIGVWGKRSWVRTKGGK
jgi:hypothetical protein